MDWDLVTSNSLHDEMEQQPKAGANKIEKVTPPKQSEKSDENGGSDESDDEEEPEEEFLEMDLQAKNQDNTIEYEPAEVEPADEKMTAKEDTLQKNEGSGMKRKCESNDDEIGADRD
ncbi:hypothetical protein NPIL_606521 [Nephila pilipes]|uniref:Uncharacterized protein n=1 Tax=Nephila pilipes TaxID=299642 RepID=A0A8X6ISD2_NEPPI|nr:hypothetical protein NPIL_606521 [Nephila pilipes]